jgi:hypothetical protein
VHIHLLNEPELAAASSQKPGDAAKKKLTESPMLFSGERPLAKK